MNRPQRILLVDDEALVLSSLRRLLVRAGFDVGTANSGPEALARLGTEPFDLILSDFKMPGMNGVEFLRRAVALCPAAVRCMLTAQADKETLERALAEGTCHRAFKKPWDNGALVAALGEMLA